MGKKPLSGTASQGNRISSGDGGSNPRPSAWSQVPAPPIGSLDPSAPKTLWRFSETPR